MTKLIFATNNKHKVEELQLVIGKSFQLLSLEEAGIKINIPEPHDSLEDNAREKSITIYNLTQQNCFSEDTGLEVAALNGQPGVKSARYAGEGSSMDENISKLLNALQGNEDHRQAQFRTVISLIIHGKEYQFEGICQGIIACQPKGSRGFGYDAVFVPFGNTLTFAEMSLEEKTRYSHRKKAADKLIDFLQENV
jgi:XTP/dITP diphosphohydrolase